MGPNRWRVIEGPCEAAAMIVRPSEPGDVGGMQQLASRVWPSGWHPGGLGWGLPRHALADSIVVAVDEDGSIVGFAGRGGDEIFFGYPYYKVLVTGSGALE